MSESIRFHFKVDGNDFTRAGEASSETKNRLKQLGLPSDVIRKVSIAMYEGEINMVIHATGGTADVEVDDHCITMILKDNGPGIRDISLAMQEGYSTAKEEIRSLGFGAGMGLPNMKRYADEFDIQSKVPTGTTLTMKVYHTK